MDKRLLLAQTLLQAAKHIIAELGSSAHSNPQTVSAGKTTFFHGGAANYEQLKDGDGIDGKGVYLTSDRNRALMYAKKNNKGEEREPFITEVLVDLGTVKLWDDDAKVDLRDFTQEPWLKELVEKHGPDAPFMTGQNARIYLGWSEDNSELQKLGYQAIKRHKDLIVLDSKIIEFPKAKAESSSNTEEAEADSLKNPFQMAKEEDSQAEADSLKNPFAPVHQEGEAKAEGEEEEETEEPEAPESQESATGDDLKDFINNHRVLSIRKKAIVTNLTRKKERGAYSRGLAVKTFLYLVEDGARRFSREKLEDAAKWKLIFPLAVRKQVAKSLADDFDSVEEKPEEENVEDKTEE